MSRFNPAVMSRFFLSLFLFCGTVFAQTVSLHEAKECASYYFAKQGMNKVPVGSAIVYGSQNSPDMYVINMSGGGWIMLSGIYFVCIRSGNTVKSAKVIIIE